MPGRPLPIRVADRVDHLPTLTIVEQKAGRPMTSREPKRQPSQKSLEEKNPLDPAKA